MSKKTKNNFYVVRKGYDLKNKKFVTNRTFKTWDEAKVFVIGISFKKHGVTPEYAGFVTKEEADSYLTGIAKHKYKNSEHKNFYAVKLGYDKDAQKIIRNEIYPRWSIALRFVLNINQGEHGVIPIYQGFNTKEEALAYLYGQSTTQDEALEGNYYAIRTGFDKETGEIIENQIIKGWSDAREYLEDITLEEHGIQIEFEKFSKRSRALTYILEKFPDANRIKLKIS